MIERPDGAQACVHAQQTGVKISCVLIPGYEDFENVADDLPDSQRTRTAHSGTIVMLGWFRVGYYVQQHVGEGRRVQSKQTGRCAGSSPLKPSHVFRGEGSKYLEPSHASSMRRFGVPQPAGPSRDDANRHTAGRSDHTQSRVETEKHTARHGKCVTLPAASMAVAAVLAMARSGLTRR